MILTNLPKQSSQRGFITILVALLVITLAGVYLFKPNFGLNTKVTNACLTQAPNRTISFNFGDSVTKSDVDSVFERIKLKATEEPYKSMASENYRLIRTISAIPEAVFPYHLGKAGQIDYGGKLRQIYVVLTHCDGIIPFLRPPQDCAPEDSEKVAAVNFVDPSDPKGINAFNLLFIDVTDDPSKAPNPMPGYIYTEIYLKEDALMPKFVEDFCEQFKGSESEKALNPILIIEDGKQNSVPPLKVNVDPNPKITVEYTRVGDSLSDKRTSGEIGGELDLMAYAPINSSFVQSQGIVPPLDFPNISKIKGIYRDSGKDYYIGFVSYASFIILIEKENPNNVYYYKKIDGRKFPLQSPAASPDQSLQLKNFIPITIQPMGWWTPECKPAIYLYPEKSQEVSVKVFPKGNLAYTDPLYPKDGWKVMADPNGRIISDNKTYPYLYYESKIMDGWIKKPTEGFVVAFEDLPKLYSDLLPKLGLSSSETADFKQYWEKALTLAPYYFVGVMENSAIERIEPLEINPKPDTTIRVRLYFQALEKDFKVLAPKIGSLSKREGFSVVEWGGLVKNDPNHPFTCSQ